MRGAPHRKGDYAFTVLPGEGLVVLPVAPERDVARRVARADHLRGGRPRRAVRRRPAAAARSRSSPGRPAPARPCSGLEFLASAADRGERGLLLGYEESPEQIGRNAVGAGRAFDRLRADGTLQVVSVYPEEASLEDHLLEIKQLIDDLRPGPAGRGQPDRPGAGGQPAGVPRVRRRSHGVRQAARPHRAAHRVDARPGRRPRPSPRGTSPRSPTPSSCSATTSDRGGSAGC